MRSCFFELLLIGHVFGHFDCLGYDVVVLLADVELSEYLVLLHCYYTAFRRKNNPEKTSIINNQTIVIKHVLRKRMIIFDIL